MTPHSKQIAEKRMPEVEVTASASFEDLLKLPDGQAVVVDVAKIRQALQTAERRGESNRDRGWMLGLYKMFGNSKGGRVGMAILKEMDVASLKSTSEENK